ncbi:MAG: aminopeptidase P family N-terminal domain-containing protein, partial [Bacteroidales bacterium]
MGNIYAERVESLRNIIERKGIDALVITGSDPHSSEYPAPRWKQVEWITGFTGEAGDVVITLDHAGLWTDTRYFIQANKQLDGTGIALHKTRVQGQVLIPEWLAENNLFTVAVDGKSQNVSSVRAIKDAFRKAGKAENLNIIDMPDILDGFWSDRPEIPQTPIITLGEEIAGESRPHKISRIRKFLMGNNLDGILLTSLEEIAWTLNVRASDIAFNPVCISYLLISMDSVKWYVKKDALNQFDS